jgi:hypothetical protein
MMEKKGNEAKDQVDVVTELGRIMLTGFLSIVLTVVALLLDGPVSILGWLLMVAALLCMIYVVVASRNLKLLSRSPDHKAEPHE